MSHSEPYSQFDIPENVIPFKTKTNGMLNNHLKNKANAFLVKSDKIFFLAVLYVGKDRRHYGNGYVTFPDESKYCFKIEANDDPGIRDRCLAVGRRIARVFGGTVRQGSIDRYGRFYNHEAGDPDSAR